jgi:hypothetical protein
MPIIHKSYIIPQAEYVFNAYFIEKIFSQPLNNARPNAWAVFSSAILGCEGGGDSRPPPARRWGNITAASGRKRLRARNKTIGSYCLGLSVRGSASS